MYTNTNKKELQKIANYIYNITDTVIAIYDENKNRICSYPAPDSMCEFCSEIRRSSELTQKCYESDDVAFEICKSTRQPHIYHCHIGLLEVAAPIIYDNMVLGYIQFGQITDLEDKTALLSNIKNIADSYHLDYDVLVSSLPKIQYRTNEYILSISKLLEMCANYIWLNSIISIKKEGLAYNIDLYIKEHLGETLSVSKLCHQFSISRSTLYEISKNNFGCSISEYIQNQRIERAKELLKNPELTISEVSEAVGIKDANYFIRFFKKRTQCTPKAYQKKATR